MSKLKNYLFDTSISGKAAFGLLIARFVFGLGMMIHGLPKIQHAFNWMGEDASVPGFLQALAALSEFGGGIAIILGLLTPIALLGIVFTMMVAIFMVHVSQGHQFIGKPHAPSYEAAALYLVFAVMLFLTGPGKYSLDNILLTNNK